MSKIKNLPIILGLFALLIPNAVIIAQNLMHADHTSSAVAQVTPNLPSALAAPSAPVLQGGFGILGDSSSDEYRANDNRGGKYAVTTLNWVELLAKRRHLDFGTWGTWGEPRRTGYAYNWARSGATTDDLIRAGQHLGLAKQVASGQVAYVLVWVGVNDFTLWNGTYQEIYDGRLNDAAVQSKVNHLVLEITTAVDAVQNAKPVPMVLVGIADYGLAPDIVTAMPDAAKRQRVTAAINAVNAKLADAAKARAIPFVNPSEFLRAFAPRIDRQGILRLSGERINFLGKGNEPHFGRLDDSAGHPGTVVSGLLANYIFVEPFNRAFGLGIAPLSEQEILQDAGIGLSRMALPSR